MSGFSPRRARARRLASLLSGTALVGVASLSMTVTEANAACSVTAAGAIDCLANTATTLTTNLNGGNNPSTDRTQQFDNGANITANIGAGVIVSNYGLQLLLSNVGANTIDVTNSGTLTNNQGINALELYGNGGQITYGGTGTVSATASGNAMVVVNSGAGGVSVSNNGVFSSASGYALFVDTLSATGPVTINGSGSFSGLSGIYANVDGTGDISMTGTGSILGATATGVEATTLGGNVLIATGSTISGGVSGIRAGTGGAGTVTVTTGGAVTGTTQWGILTNAGNGATTINAGNNVTGGSEGIRSNSGGVGVIDINHTAGTVSAGTVGIVAAHTGAGVIDISQTGGALNGTTGGVSASTSGAGNIGVSLTGGTVGDVSGRAVFTSATSGTTSITTDVNLSSSGDAGIAAVSTTTGAINVGGSGAVSGATYGIQAQSFGSGHVNVTSTGAVTSTGLMGLLAGSVGGNVMVATGSAISGVAAGMEASTSVNGTVSVTTGGAVTGSAGFGIITVAGNGATTVDVGHAVTAGSQGIRSSAAGAGLIGINHSAGTITAGTIGIRAAQTGTGAIDIAQTGGVLNGTTGSVLAAMTGSGNVGVSLTGGTVGAVGGNTVETSATSGTTSISTGVAVTSTGANAINATATSGNITIVNGSTVTGATNAVFGSTSGTFNITNTGTLNGNLNVTGSNAASTFATGGIWNAGPANSTFSGNLTNTGTVNAQNGVAGQTLAFAGNYSGNGVYRVDLNAAGNADRLNVGGTATLTGGTVNALFLPGAYVSRNYTILSATGGLAGTTFSGLSTSALPAGFVASLSYTPTDVLINLAAVLGGGISGANLNRNQQNVAGSINNFFNNGGALPPGFVQVFGLTGATLGNALTQLSGEHATGVQPAANLSTGMFLGAMLDPFVTGRSGGFGAAMGYAPEVPSRGMAAAREAFAAHMPAKAPAAVPYVEPLWNVWGSAYGGRNRTDGDAVLGSNDVRATAAGFAAGADYRVRPGTVIGAAVAIGENRWNVSDFGRGNADVAQFGGYFSSRWNSLYLSGAAAVAAHRASTERTLNIAGVDRLTAGFNATSFGGRLEGGYRIGAAAFGVTPYAAVQVTSIHTPSYGEVAAAGLNQFALSYQAQSTTDSRTELGSWADTRHQFGNGMLLTLRGRAAWVHDYNPGSRINAAFQTLPGASFVVDGAAAPRNAALTSAVAELRMTNGWTLIGKFDGEFSDRSHTLAATGTVKYAW